MAEVVEVARVEGVEATARALHLDPARLAPRMTAAETMHGEAWARRRPAPVTVDTTPIECSLRELGGVALRQARRRSG